MKLYATKNDLPEATRNQVIALCNARLADSVDLQTQVKQAHWNVKGPEFIALHELFDKINEDVEEYVDLTAERVVQLGGTALGTARLAIQASKLSEYPAGLASGKVTSNCTLRAKGMCDEPISGFFRSLQMPVSVRARMRSPEQTCV